MKQTSSRKRALSQLIFLLIIIVFSLITWFNNEKKDQQKVERQKTTQPKTTVSPNSLEQSNYDTVMANDKLGRNNVATDYFQLALSWSPAFCDSQREKHGDIPASSRYQCHNEFGWVIHGLWPQSAKARDVAEHPRFCQGDLPALPFDTFKPYLNSSPSAALLQGQWEKHGACAFNRAEDYFARQQALFNELKLPTQELSRKALFQWVKQHNPTLRDVYLGASKNELYICYDKQWKPIDCR